jgi:D-alanyl-D-alanine carboxypeptidase
MRIWTAIKCASVGIFLTFGEAAHADAALQSFLDEALAWLRNRDHDPAIAALIQIDGKVVAESAIGARSLSHPEAVTVSDQWHIGSDTKAFTATLIGTLVDRRVMSFDDTLDTSLPALAKSMNPAYRKITVRQLLSHTAGLPPLTNTETDFPTALAVVKTVRDVSAQRAALARYYLTRPPASAAEKFNYSNLGYVIAAAIAEAHAGNTWERLVRVQVFEPLGIKHVGFGPPGHSGQYDQPLGHAEVSGTLTPLDPADPDSDNPAWLGPAGTINLALKDWVLFAQDQIDGALGYGKLLRSATYKQLQTPVIDGYALGWGVRQGPDGVPVLLTHNGSNGYWMSTIRIYPKRDTIILGVANFGGAVAEKSIHDLGDGLADHLKLLTD